LIVADPVRSITLHAVLWNENIIPSASLVGKAVILSRFKLSEFKNTLSLASVHRSSIIPVSDHAFKKHE
jgi:hypothetical protein